MPPRSHDTSTTALPLAIPVWMGMWFALFPNVEGTAAQLAAGGLVIGSFFLARRACCRTAQPDAVSTPPAPACLVLDCDHCVARDAPRG